MKARSIILPAVSEESGYHFGNEIMRCLNTFSRIKNVGNSNSVFSFDSFKFVCMDDSDNILCVVFVSRDDDGTFVFHDASFLSRTFGEGMTDRLNK